jgi:hypothetical protein
VSDSVQTSVSSSTPTPGASIDITGSYTIDQIDSRGTCAPFRPATVSVSGVTETAFGLTTTGGTFAATRGSSNSFNVPDISVSGDFEIRNGVVVMHAEWPFAPGQSDCVYTVEGAKQ